MISEHKPTNEPNSHALSACNVIWHCAFCPLSLITEHCRSSSHCAPILQLLEFFSVCFAHMEQLMQQFSLPWPCTWVTTNVPCMHKIVFMFSQFWNSNDCVQHDVCVCVCVCILSSEEEEQNHVSRLLHLCHKVGPKLVGHESSLNPPNHGMQKHKKNCPLINHWPTLLLAHPTLSHHDNTNCLVTNSSLHPPMCSRKDFLCKNLILSNNQSSLGTNFSFKMRQSQCALKPDKKWLKKKSFQQTVMMLS